MEEGTNGHYDRRKDDERFAEFMGEFRQWKVESNEWRDQTDETLKGIHAIFEKLTPEKIDEMVEFMESVRTPRKFIVWTIRAIVVAAIGSIGAAVVGFVKGHVHFQ